MAIAVEDGLVPKALTGCHGLAGSDLQDGGYNPNIEMLPALIEYKASVQHICGNVCLETNKLK